MAKLCVTLFTTIYIQILRQLFCDQYYKYTTPALWVGYAQGREDIAMGTGIGN